MTTVFNVRETSSAWQRDPRCVYVGRYAGRGRNHYREDSPFANPYRIGGFVTREISIAWYTHWLYEQPFAMQTARDQLKGRRLGCWCAPEACHADVLARLCDLPGPDFELLVSLVTDTADSPWQWRAVDELADHESEKVMAMINRQVIEGRPSRGGHWWRWAPLTWMPNEIIEFATTRCMYCGCHEERGCSILVRSPDGKHVHHRPCSWIAPCVCDAPGCFALFAWDQIQRDRTQSQSLADVVIKSMGIPKSILDGARKSRTETPARQGPRADRTGV